jgi:hypothetical protein
MITSFRGPESPTNLERIQQAVWLTTTTYPSSFPTHGLEPNAELRQTTAMTMGSGPSETAMIDGRHLDQDRFADRGSR